METFMKEVKEGKKMDISDDLMVYSYYDETLESDYYNNFFNTEN